MNKTLVSLSLAALFSTSSQALSLYADEKTAINLDAEFRLLAVVQEEEIGGLPAEQSFTKDDESRLTVSFEHSGDIASVVGTIQIRFSEEGNEDGDDDKNNTFTKLLFAGLKTDNGTLLGGRQYTFVDEAELQDVSYNFGDQIAMGSDYDSSAVKYTYSADNYAVGFLFTIPTEGLDNSGETVQAMIKTKFPNGDFKVIIGQDDDGPFKGIYFNADMGYTIDQFYLGGAINYIDLKGTDTVLGYGVGAKYATGDAGFYAGYEGTDMDSNPYTWYLGSDYNIAQLSVIFAEFGEHSGGDGMSFEVGLRAQF
jgi:hypothetical protein